MSAPYPTYEQEEAAAYRETPEYRELYRRAECRLCGESVYEDTILGDRVCEPCAELHGLTRCDYCGRVLHRQHTVTVQESGDGGRTIAWTYCHPCEREARAD